jgi:hypothetical protein
VRTIDDDHARIDRDPHINGITLRILHGDRARTTADRRHAERRAWSVRRTWAYGRDACVGTGGRKRTAVTGFLCGERLRRVIREDDRRWACAQRIRRRR